MVRTFLIAMIASGALYSDEVEFVANKKPERVCVQKKNPPSPYGVFVEASFLYWYAAQDGMTVGYSGDIVGDLGTYPSPVIQFLAQPFEYKPGFKVGVGYGTNEWEVEAQYTWIRNQTSISADTSKNPTFGDGNIPVWVSAWFAAGYIPTPHLSSSWKLAMDWVDVTGAKSYSKYEAMTIAPFGGIRALWIRQSFLVKETAPLGGSGLPPGASSFSYTNCWGLGPVCGASGRCPIGAGFTLEANGGLSLLFTQYTTLFRKEENVNTNGESPEADVTNLKLRIKDYNCVRPAANLGLGLGWQRSLYEGIYRLHFAATYDFNVFWDQNMLHYLQDAYSNFFIANDLFLHGLTLTGRFEF